jgi:Ni/Fe-hydrogenase subunit HybB-like protein
MEVHGHIVTGMNNQVVWGLPHVFAIFMIVAASGVLNVASIGSVFGQAVYKPRAPLSGLLCIALLMGGLMVLMLDLGSARSRDRRRHALQLHVGLRLERLPLFGHGRRWSPSTCGRCSSAAECVCQAGRPGGPGLALRADHRHRLDLRFLVARQAYHSALLAPLFIVLSFGWGLAVFLVAQSTMYAWEGRVLDGEVQRRMARLLGVFVAASLYLVAVYHLTNLYFAKQLAFERFLLVDGGLYPVLFWAGYVLVGSVLPLLLLFHPRLSSARNTLCRIGAAWWRGRSPGSTSSSSAGRPTRWRSSPAMRCAAASATAQVASYVPSLPEFLLGVGGLGAALLLTVVGVACLRLHAAGRLRVGLKRCDPKVR